MHCITSERIPDYFLKSQVKKPLAPEEVARLSRAFLALARMDEGFGG